MAAKKSVKEPETTAWSDPGFFAQQPVTRNVFRVIKQLFIPPDGHRTIPTWSGVILILLALGIGSAAYNTASNILFITLSLLLSCLILSGIMSWINYKGVEWRMVLEPHFRAGEVTPLRIEVRNTKRFLPTYALKFNLRVGEGEQRNSLYLPDRLDPGHIAELEWLYEPPSRGKSEVRLHSLETQFPFGFLKKTVAGVIQKERIVWPPKISYEFRANNYQRGFEAGATRKKSGSGAEIIKVREYQTGDSQRSVHWKATARMQKLMVRETTAEHKESFYLYFEAASAIWTDGAQFDRACAFMGSLAEDLYMQGRLAGYALNSEPIQPVQKLADVHALLGRLAVLEPVQTYPSFENFHGSVITFAPGNRGAVYAYVGGIQTGEA